MLRGEMKHFLLAGSHPELTRAEAEAVLGFPITERAASMLFFESAEDNGAVWQERLAGTVKLGEIVFEERISNNEYRMSELAKRLADEIDARPRGDRVLFGLTLFGSVKDRTRLKKLPIELKRTLQERGRSVRWVTGDKGEISPAAVAKLKLTTEGYDFVIGIANGNISVGLTTHVQNADAWSDRDYGRPFRDAKTGMLPPKLARMMVNLANPPGTGTILDPFCGGGAVLMEAAMLFPAAEIIGADIDAKQVAGTKRNFEWLQSKGFVSKTTAPNLIVSPVQDLAAHLKEGSVDAIVTEGYLGNPLRGTEMREELFKNKKAVEAVWNGAIPVLARLLKPGGRLVCVWPEYVSGRENVRTDASKAAEAAGLRRVRLPLAYSRANQRLVRNIFIYEKKA